MNLLPDLHKDPNCIFTRLQPIVKWGLAGLVLGGILLTRLYSYLLFHAIVEIFSTIVAFGIFILAWNSSSIIKNTYLSIIGIGFFFVAAIDILHMLTFKGMGVFSFTSANIPTQLWLAARYLEAFILLAAPFFLRVIIRENLIFGIISSITILFVITIFFTKMFPVAYVDGVGLTAFKIYSEYVIIAIMVTAGMLLWRNRADFDRNILKLLIIFLAYSISAEFMFTFYVGVTDWANMAGHIFKIIAFYFLYQALVETGFRLPYSLIFHQLKQKEEKILTDQIELQRLLAEAKETRQTLLRVIEDQKRAEAEKEEIQSQLLHSQKMESVGLLAGGIAHDFNNQLNVIIGNAEMALARLSPSSVEYYDIQQILSAAGRSADLVSKLLAFSRKQVVNPMVLDINETIASMLRMLKRMIGEDIELIWLPGSKLKPVLMDPLQVDQVLVNLIVNSRDAINGNGKIIIETASEVIGANKNGQESGLAAGEYAVLMISDNGSGMDTNILSHIFEPFFTTKEMGKGTGLGLATSYGIIKQNLGDITVTSTPGVATTFKIYLPATNAVQQPIKKDGSITALLKGTETILIVEDEVELLHLCRDILEDSGYFVLSANSPDEALRLAQEHQGAIDLVISDVIMPEMNGKELINQIRQLRPGFKSLFISGYTADIISDHGILGSDLFFLQKPFSLTALSEKVQQALGTG